MDNDNTGSAQQQGRDDQVGWIFIVDVAAKNDGGHQHRKGVDEPTLQKAQKFSCAGLHGFR